MYFHLDMVSVQQQEHSEKAFNSSADPQPCNTDSVRVIQGAVSAFTHYTHVDRDAHMSPREVLVLPAGVKWK